MIVVSYITPAATRRLGLGIRITTLAMAMMRPRQPNSDSDLPYHGAHHGPYTDDYAYDYDGNYKRRPQQLVAIL